MVPVGMERQRKGTKNRASLRVANVPPWMPCGCHRKAMTESTEELVTVRGAVELKKVSRPELRFFRKAPVRDDVTLKKVSRPELRLNNKFVAQLHTTKATMDALR